MAKNKKFRLVDAILSVITVVFVAEAAAPAAAIGNSQFFWWIFLIIAFLLPYGLVVSELGTTYDDEGGLYDWVRRAFGDKWGSRVSWYENRRQSNNLAWGEWALQDARTRETGEVTPFAALIYDLNEHLSVYASYADIFQPQSTYTDESGSPLQPKTGASYELGIKGE